MAKPERPVIAKVDPTFYNKLKEVAIKRLANGVDKKLTKEQGSVRRYTKAMTRYTPLWNILEKAEFVDDKKAQFSIFSFIILAFLTVVFFGGLIYAQGLIYNVLHDVGVQNDKVSGSNPMYVNMTLAADVTFGQVNQSIQALRMVALVYILCLGVSIMITNALLKVHPLWFFAYILIAVLAVIFSVPISNAYYTLLNSGIYEGGLSSFTGANWILLNLPVITAVVAIFGFIFLLINLIRTTGETSLQ